MVRYTYFISLKFGIPMQMCDVCGSHPSRVLWGGGGSENHHIAMHH